MGLAKEKNPQEGLITKAPSYLASDLVTLELGSDWTASVDSYLEQSREAIHQKMDQGMGAGRVVHLHSLMMDRLITLLFQQSLPSPVPLALFALGGYGRGELNLYSDIDLLLIYEGKSSKAIEPITNKMLYPLWDAKVEVGYSIRTIQDCSKVMREDVRAMSSMLDARFLGGDQELAGKYFKFLESKVASTRALKLFIQAKLDETEDRLSRFGGSVYMIEPNLKESKGGLRDYHTLRYFARLALRTPDREEWVRRGFLTNEEADQLRRALEFFWDVRNRLHRKAGRNLDQLLFAFQEPIALEMGYETGGGTLGVEKFMQTYYGHAAELFRLRGEVTRRILESSTSMVSRIKNLFRSTLGRSFVVIEGKIIPKNYSKLEKNPVEIMRAFWFAQTKNLSLDAEFKSWISQHLHLIDDAFREHPEVCEMLRELFADVSGIGRTLWEMYDCRFLGVLIPEFGDILYQTQHDVYHVYTVDTHSIIAVNEISKLKNGVYDSEFPVFKAALEEIYSIPSLVLSVLFHDIGKGKGGGHSEIGAKLARKIMSRMGYPQKDIKRVEFLVLSHLIMPHLSQRRDMEDAALISQFARTMETRERLNLLFILTWADIRAVGPEVWTPWKGSLLTELYQKTQQVLESGEFSTDRAADVMKQVKNETLKNVSEAVSQKKLRNFMNSMPPRYFLANPSQKILEHFEWIHTADSHGFVFQQAPNIAGNYNDIFIYTVNSPHLFEQVTGVMAANQVNILALEQFFSSAGEALLQLKVTDQKARLLEEERRINNLRRDLQKVFLGKVALEKFYEERRQPAFLQRKLIPTKPPRVEIDNVVSPYYSIIDIFADDRIGLLYDLARVIRKLNLFIEVSKISTKVDQVADVFYVKDIFGQKITGKKKVDSIKESIIKVLTEDH